LCLFSTLSSSVGCDATCAEFPEVSWTDERFIYIIQLRQKALELARLSFADFFFSIDADAFLTNPSTLEHLMSTESLVVAPLLPSAGLYSNFWAGMTESFYYKRTEEYRWILDRKMVGVHEVPMVHSCVLVDLRQEESDLLAYDPAKVKEYNGPVDDMIVFALSARLSAQKLYVDNREHYGVIMLPLDEKQELKDDLPMLVCTLLEATVKGPIIKVLPSLDSHIQQLPPKSKLGFDEIFMVNLERRQDRHDRMMYNFDNLGISYKLVPAVDGRKMDETFLAEKGITMLPQFSEPFHGRALTYGEIGCFLSHYQLWQRMVDENLETVLILEDDIKFEPYFVEKLEYLKKELVQLGNSWDLVYIGRKILHNSEEPWLEGSEQLVRVDYTYWTLAYILTLRGAKTLLAAEPLNKMVPVDEFLPIMYNRHPNKTWVEQFPGQKLSALSVHPLLVFPTHYTGEHGYFSDTEDTSVITDMELLTGKEGSSDREVVPDKGSCGGPGCKDEL